jgi:methionyl aminopeptidase
MGRVVLKTPAEIQMMRKAGQLLASIFDRIEPEIRPGVTTADLDELARRWIVDAGATPAFLGYNGFPATLCTSVNEEVVHGIPGNRVLNEGDIISVDCGLRLGGFFADRAMTYPVGKISAEAAKLLEVTRDSLEVAIDVLEPGVRLGTLGYAIQEFVEARGFSVVRNYGGHGIGRKMHEEPHISNHGRPDTGLRLQAGMVLAIEPMVNIGAPETLTLADEWTVVTADRKWSAHFEHTIAITAEGAQVLTS